jgi:hypothetical protein
VLVLNPSASLILYLMEPIRSLCGGIKVNLVTSLTPGGEPTQEHLPRVKHNGWPRLSAQLFPMSDPPFGRAHPQQPVCQIDAGLLQLGLMKVSGCCEQGRYGISSRFWIRSQPPAAYRIIVGGNPVVTTMVFCCQNPGNGSF